MGKGKVAIRYARKELSGGGGVTAALVQVGQRKTMLLIRVEKVMNYNMGMAIRFILGVVGVVFMSKWKKMLLIKVEKVV